MQQDYITDITYLSGYFPELSVPRLMLCLLAAGQGHGVGTEPSYLELGYGQGLSLAVHAAALAGHYVGTDFNAAHAANAQTLVQPISRPVEIYDDSFESLAARPELDMFDVVVLHGIWSWVSAESRQAIIDIASRHLRPGGILYVSYNAIPGWSPGLPLRHLMNEYAQREATGPLLARVEQSIEFASQLASTGARYFTVNPQMDERLTHIRGSDRQYLAHEFFNQHWLPMAFSDVAGSMSQAKLGFAASASLIENLESIYLSSEAATLLGGISNPILRETTRDYVINQQFRRDIYVKGARTLSPSELRFQRLTFPFVVLGATEEAPASVMTPLGSANLRTEIYGPLAQALFKFAGQRVSLQQVKVDAAVADIPIEQLWEAMLVLVAAGWLSPCPMQPPAQEALANALAFNRALAARAVHTEEAGALAAPAIGAGLPVSRFDLLFLHAHLANEPSAPAFINELLIADGRRLLVNGKPVEDDAAQLAVLADMQDRFRSDLLPRLERLGAI